MYFNENQLEIRDRINGNIVHYQNSAITPFSILTFISSLTNYFLFTTNINSSF